MRLATLALGMLAALPAPAATYIVDDTASIPYESNVATRWRDNAATGGRQMSNEIEGAVTITTRLNVQPWQNRNGRIYLALPQQTVGVVNVEWSTQGRLLPGKLQSGERTLIYAGPIRTPVLEDTFIVRVTADGRRVNATQKLKFHFEIDVD
jgi:hypothetical protein